MCGTACRGSPNCAPRRSRRARSQRLLRRTDVHAGAGAFVDPNAGKSQFEPYAVEVLAARPDEASTRARDQSVLRTHVLPEFDDRAIGSITHSEVQRWVTKLGTRRSPATTREAYRILHLVIKMAVRDHIIGHDPCLDVKLPKRARRSVAAGGFPMLSAEDFALVLREVPDRHRLAAALSFGTGLRWGETAALTVGDFTGLSGEPMTVTVKRTLQEVGGAFSIKLRPKSEAGARQVPLPEWVATIVRRHVATYGQRLDDNLIVNEVGGFVSRGYARLYILRPALVRADSWVRSRLQASRICLQGGMRPGRTGRVSCTSRRSPPRRARRGLSPEGTILRRRHGMGFVTRMFRLWSPRGLTRCMWRWRRAIQILPSPCEPTRTPPRMPLPGFGLRSPTSKWTDDSVLVVASAFLFADPAEGRKERFYWSG